MATGWLPSKDKNDLRVTFFPSRPIAWRGNCCTTQACHRQSLAPRLSVLYPRLFSAIKGVSHKRLGMEHCRFLRLNDRLAGGPPSPNREQMSPWANRTPKCVVERSALMLECILPRGAEITALNLGSGREAKRACAGLAREDAAICRMTTGKPAGGCGG